MPPQKPLRHGLEPTRDESTLALSGLQADTDFLRSAPHPKLDFEMLMAGSPRDSRTLRDLAAELLDETALRALAELIAAPCWHDQCFRVIGGQRCTAIPVGLVCWPPDC